MRQQTEVPRHPTPYPLRFEPGIREAAQAKADAAERSLNWMVNRLLRQALEGKAA